MMILSKGGKSSHLKTPLISLKSTRAVGVLYWERYFFAIDYFLLFFQAEAAL